jgi:hypothetical protein
MGALASTCDLFVQFDDEKTWKNQGRLDQLQLLAAILARWWLLVGSNKALNLLYRTMRTVLYRCTATAIKMASLLGTFFCRCFVCCCPGGHWGNTEWVVAQWQHPVASGVALDMPHWAMPSVLLQRTAVAIETAGRWGAFVCHRCLVCIIIHSYKTMLWSIKTTDELT